MTEYVRLVDAGLIQVKALDWNWWGVGFLVAVLGWLLWDAIRARSKVGWPGPRYDRRR